MSIRPASIDLDRDAGELRITWTDDRICVYPLSNMREACPCAECRGGHALMGRAHDPEHILSVKPTRAIGLDKVDFVGNYALQFFWEDGHHAGIFTWEFLYRLCPPDNV
jgi:DUF971 family protein